MAIRETFHDARTVQRHVASGAWANRTLDDDLRRHARERGEKLALVDRRWRLTYGELDRLAQRVACGLLELGVGAGDVVSMQLPNWAEWLIVHCAATRIGAVTNSIGAVYRQREVGYILEHASASVVVIPDVFRGFSYTAMIDELRPRLSHLRHVLVVGDRVPDGMQSFPRFVDTPWEDHYSAADVAARRPDPNAVTTLMFTSGTEANPKGVMQTHNSLGAGTRQPAEAMGWTADDVVFMPSPIGHITAVLLGARVPIMYGMTAVWQEYWNAEEAVALIAREGCTFTFSATPFLHGLVHAPNANRDTLRSFRLFGCGGAPIPRELIRRAEDLHGFRVAACYGSSEALVNSMTTADVPRDRRYTTDGRILDGQDARVVDPETGVERSGGEAGELQVRTPALFAGYYRDPVRTQEVLDDDGWYSTGDLCVLDGPYVSVVGRKKDMIIRGGANISAREIEELLFTHPKVAAVACVAMPDPVLAERVCAFVVCAPGEPLAFDEMIAFLKAQRIAAWKLPERLEVRDAFPMTPSGKVQKYLLREEIARLVGQPLLVR
jgi:acyl-CoA synthetase (AMP-forming)/AMP-acid ligase II